MSQSFFGTRSSRVLGLLAPGNRYQTRERTIRRFPAVEPLEQRALLSNITASGVLSSTPVGSSFADTITLTNSSSSNSGIGTFWFAWTPSGTPFGANWGGPEDLLTSPPSAVTPPSGWTGSITTNTEVQGDGYGIEFTATSPASYLQPGSSLKFGFQTSEVLHLDGTSNTDVLLQEGRSYVFPGAPPVSGSGSLLFVNPATINSPPQVVGIAAVSSKKGLTSFTVSYNEALSAGSAHNSGLYHVFKGVTEVVKKHRITVFTKALAIKSVSPNSSATMVTITLAKPFKGIVEVRVVGTVTAANGVSMSVNSTQIES